MNFTFEQLKQAYEVSGSMLNAANLLSISKDTFRNLYYNLQGLCVRCLENLDKKGLICSKCLEIDRNKVKAKLPKSKICKQCSIEMSRNDVQSNISWAKQKICDKCEIQNSLDCGKIHYKNNKQNYLAYNKTRKEYFAAWRKSEKGKIIRKASNHRRRAQKRDTASENIDIYILNLFENLAYCFYCKSQENLQIEHLIPLSRGGGHCEDNVVLACKKCNLQKGNKLPNEYQDYLKGVL